MNRTVFQQEFVAKINIMKILELYSPIVFIFLEKESLSNFIAIPVVYGCEAKSNYTP